MKIEVTEKGFEVIGNVYPAWQNAQRKAIDILGKHTADRIISAGNKHLLEGITL